jgi:hypothetical protein
VTQNQLDYPLSDDLLYAMAHFLFEKSSDPVARRALFLTPLLVLLAAGCQREQVKVYHVSKEQDPQPPAASASATNSSSQALPPGHPDISSVTAPAAPVVDQSASPQLTWKTPASWAEVPPSEMRVASFKVAGANGKQADVSVVPLGGMGGTDLGNVNRWRGQVGLTAITDSELQKTAESVVAGGQAARLYDIDGTNPASGEQTRILGVIQHRDSEAWFYKMTGDADLVRQQKPAFVEFLKSLNFAATAAPAALPAGHPAISDMNVPAASSEPVSHVGQPNWQVPSDWKEVSGGQFLIAKFLLTGDGGATAAVNVSSSAGDGGGLAANVNRWRGQLGLPPSNEISSTPVDVSGGQGQLVDFSGTNAQTGQPARLVAVVVSQSGQTWFYKLMGDSKAVAKQRDAFNQFVRSVNYPDGH